ncbi:DUF1801 domain-containing protein [Telluribacter sp. SYSU D00476]|uniref:DUF1801 domain-containing protein n=1 Tax=Telluribacter sp. SYSU D00476 TaxID=2811430 RepID=UPI001FF53130|nr:DUF1801 domain-containing protein [Telluribacter sp. SYSU D00476]
METKAESIEDYLDQLPTERKEAVLRIRETILANLPAGYEEALSYGTIGYVVPHSLYPAGYHCDPKLPLPFMSLASQKNYVALYHMGLYANPELLNWFIEEYPRHSSVRLDMGKSCIRFKKVDAIPYALIGKLAGKMSTDQWISLYESQYRK